LPRQPYAFGLNEAFKRALSLQIIEVQSGEYLGEDDIERLEDQYGR